MENDRGRISRNGATTRRSATGVEEPENSAASEVIEAAFTIHRAWGPGLLESAYAAALEREMVSMGLSVESQVPVPLIWRGTQVGTAYRVDFVINSCLLVELKAVETTAPVHRRQVITYLKLSGLRLGLLLNFGEVRLSKGITRLANGMP